MEKVCSIQQTGRKQIEQAAVEHDRREQFIHSFEWDAGTVRYISIMTSVKILLLALVLCSLTVTRSGAQMPTGNQITAIDLLPEGKYQLVTCTRGEKLPDRIELREWSIVNKDGNAYLAVSKKLIPFHVTQEASGFIISIPNDDFPLLEVFSATSFRHVRESDQKPMFIREGRFWRFTSTGSAPIEGSFKLQKISE